eukprot:m.64841 g.64841  ORF g.64841 m.64841 type:complete len:457 (+) comp9730_c0_seq2:126-1496(+)
MRLTLGLAGLTAGLVAVNGGHAVTTLESPRLVAYLNCACGFGHTAIRHDEYSFDECGNDPDPTGNTVLSWEAKGQSPITHYVLSFLSFDGGAIQTDPGSIWADGGGSLFNFALEGNISAAMSMAQRNGKKIMLSLGGETGSSRFIEWWHTHGTSSEARVAGMRQSILTAISKFERDNNNRAIKVDGIDVDIELGGGYVLGGEKWLATKELIEAVPDSYITAFVPQVGNGLCAAVVEDDLANGLSPLDTLGGQCMNPGETGAPWSLALMDAQLKRANGTPKLDWLGVQYYNAVSAVCCGGGTTEAEGIKSTAQNYKNLALGWPGVTAATMEDETSPWHSWRWWPGPWAQFEGIGADRLVLGKPGCNGCAGSNYISEANMLSLLRSIGNGLGGNGTFGGVLFWDLCRLFGTEGKFCVSTHCQPGWGSDSDVLSGLNQLYHAMQALPTSSGSEAKNAEQ